MKSHVTRRRFLQLSAAGMAAGIVPHVLQGGTSGQPAADGPNLIIYLPDQLRAESLGCYGHPLVETPHIDGFASGGVRFANAQSQYPVCTASRCSMFTGWYPHVRGHRSVYYLLRPDEPNLFKYLKNNGYDVFWYGKNDVIYQKGFDQNVTEWGFFAEGPEWSGEDNPWPRDDPHYFSFLFAKGGDRRDYPDYKRVQAAIKVLERRETDKPFCLFLPVFFPHPPFTAPEGFYNKYDPGDIPLLRPPDFEGKPGFYREIHTSRRLDQLSEQDYRKINAVYLGMISYTDWLFGQLLEAVDRTNHTKDTAIFFLSDHGEWAGDWGLVEKWSSAMDDAIMHLPFIARLPGGATGHVVDELIEMYDLMATCLDLAGIQVQHTHFAASLVPQLQGAAGDPNRIAYSEGGYNSYEPWCYEPLENFPKDHIYYPKIYLENTQPALISRTTAMKTPEYKLVLRPDYMSELYDLTNDPRELHNLYADASYETVREELEQRMLRWYVRTSDAVPKGQDPRNLPEYPGKYRYFDPDNL